MRLFLPIVCGLAALALPAPSPASAETYNEYLNRLRDICSVDCMKPRDFRRSARRRDANDAGEMAVIMDVVEVRRVGENFELLSMNMQGSPLEELAILGSAGVNTSSSTGIGGLPRGSRGGTNPNLIIIEIDEQTLFDIINVVSPLREGTVRTNPEEGIVVERDADRVLKAPTQAALRSYFRNRRVVVRGTIRLEPVLIGARRDFRRKQVTLELTDADNLVMLPRYDDDGNPILEDELEGLRADIAPTSGN